MARVLGESGRYVSDAEERDLLKLFRLFGCFAVFGGAVEGLIVGSYLPASFLGLPAKLIICVAAVIALVAFLKVLKQKLLEFHRKRQCYSRGAEGERHVGRILSMLPDEFCVVNDLSTPFGNLDHVVVGLTGIFILDPRIHDVQSSPRTVPQNPRLSCLLPSESEKK